MKLRPRTLPVKRWMVMAHHDGADHQVAAYWLARSAIRERNRRNAGIPSRPPGVVYTISRKHYSRPTTVAARAGLAAMIVTVIVLSGVLFGPTVLAIAMSTLAILIGLGVLVVSR